MTYHYCIMIDNVTHIFTVDTEDELTGLLAEATLAAVVTLKSQML